MKLLLLIILLATVSCTGYREKMLYDGNTWSVWVKDIGECNGYSSAKTCVAGLIGEVKWRGTHLCGKTPHRIFGCGKTSGDPGIKCKVQCNSTVRRELVEPIQPVQQQLTSSIIKKAKRCQKKGGVWISNACHIDVGEE